MASSSKETRVYSNIIAGIKEFKKINKIDDLSTIRTFEGMTDAEIALRLFQIAYAETGGSLSATSAGDKDLNTNIPKSLGVFQLHETNSEFFVSQGLPDWKKLMDRENENLQAVAALTLAAYMPFGDEDQQDVLKGWGHWSAYSMLPEFAYLNPTYTLDGIPGMSPSPERVADNFAHWNNAVSPEVQANITLPRGNDETKDFFVPEEDIDVYGSTGDIGPTEEQIPVETAVNIAQPSPVAAPMPSATGQKGPNNTTPPIADQITDRLPEGAVDFIEKMKRLAGEAWTQSNIVREPVLGFLNEQYRNRDFANPDDVENFLTAIYTLVPKLSEQNRNQIRSAVSSMPSVVPVVPTPTPTPTAPSSDVAVTAGPTVPDPSMPSPRDPRTTWTDTPDTPVEFQDEEDSKYRPPLSAKQKAALDAFASDTGGDVPDVTGSITPPKGAPAPRAPLAPPKPAKPIVAFSGNVFEFDNNGNIIRVKSGGSIEGSLQSRGPNSGVSDIYANLMRIGGLDEKVWRPGLRDEKLFDLIASQIEIFTTVDPNTGKYPPIRFSSRSMNPDDLAFQQQMNALISPITQRIEKAEFDYSEANLEYQTYLASGDEAQKVPAPTYPASYEKDVKLLELYSRALSATLPMESTLSPTGEFQIITGSVPRTGLTIDYLLDPNNKVHKSVYEKYGELLRSGDYVLDAVGDGSILRIAHKSNSEAPAYVISASTGNLATEADLKAAESAPIMMVNPDGTGLGKYKQHSPDAFGKIPFTEWQTVQKYNQAEIQSSIQNDLTQAEAQANQLYKAANLMRLAKQDDNANILEAFSNEEAARANDLAAINNLQAEQRQTLQNIFTAMQDPADVLAASFALTGEQSPMGQLTMADKVNAFVNRYTGMASLVQERLGRARSYKEMMSELSPAAEMAYQPPEFFEGDRPEYTPSQIAFAPFTTPATPATPSASAPATPATPATPTEPPALPPDLGAFASPPDESLPSGYVEGGTKDILSDPAPEGKFIQGSPEYTPSPKFTPEEPKEEKKFPVPFTGFEKNNRGGVNLGNPIIVGDSNDGTENEELVMSLNGSPMVVLPLDQNQQRIMARANRFIPRAQNGFPEVGDETAADIENRDKQIAEAAALAAQGQAARDAWQAQQDKYYADQKANETLEITQGQYAWTDEDDETGEKRRRQQLRLIDAATPAFSAPATSGYSTADYTIGGQSRKPATTVSNATAGIGGSASDLFSVPGFSGNITQPQIQRRSDRLTPPRAAAITSGGLRDARYGGYRPAQETQFGALGAQYATPTPSYLSALTDNERAFLKSNLATRNIFLADVEKDAKRRFGLTGTSQGSRRFTQ